MSEQSPEYTLYGHVRSGNAYKPALMLALTGTPYTFREVDLPGGEQASDAYRTQSLFATVPMLEHNGMRMRQSGTALLYLSAQTGQFGSEGPAHRLQVSEWMFWEQEYMFVGIGRSRFHRLVAPADPAVLDWLARVGNRALDTVFIDQFSQSHAIVVSEVGQAIHGGGLAGYPDDGLQVCG